MQSDAPNYEVLAAVQDLYTWFLRTRHASGAADSRADSLIRGAACLLGNHLSEAARPVLRELIGETAAAGAPEAELEELRGRLDASVALDETAGYILFGELLALYLSATGAK